MSRTVCHSTGDPTCVHIVATPLGPLQVVDDGARDAQALVLPHARGTEASLWSPQVAKFAGAYRVLRPELRGHGASPPLRSQSVMLDALADALAAVIDHTCPRRPVLIGTSLGAVIALAGAARLGERIEVLVLVGARLVRRSTTEIDMRSRAAAAEQNGLEHIASQMVARWFPSHGASIDPSLAELVRGMVRSTDPFSYAALAKGVSSYDPSAHRKSCAMPALLVSDEHDENIPPHLDSLQTLGPHVRHVRMDGVGHFPSLERTDVFNDIVAAVLSRGTIDSTQLHECTDD